MEGERTLTPAVIEDYLRSRPPWVRWREWTSGRRYLSARFEGRPRPLVLIAHPFWDTAKARQITLAVEQDWAQVPERCHESFDEILFKAPALVVLQLKRINICGCLGHRHLMVKEAPFAEPHDALDGAGVGELDIAFERVRSWQPLPLSDTALDTKFLAGSRLNEFHSKQLRLRLLSVLLHEINHLVFPQEGESSVRERSLAFYHDALAHYAETAMASISLTIDRSFSRLG